MIVGLKLCVFYSIMAEVRVQILISLAHSSLKPQIEVVVLLYFNSSTRVIINTVNKEKKWGQDDLDLDEFTSCDFSS